MLSETTKELSVWELDVVTSKGECEIIRGCHNRDKGTAENERLRNPKFIFSYPKNWIYIKGTGRGGYTGETRKSICLL